MRNSTECPASTAAWHMLLAIRVLPKPFRPTSTRLRALQQEVQGEGAFNDITIDLGWPVPFKVGQGFEAFDTRQAQPLFQASAGTFLELASTEFF